MFVETNITTALHRSGLYGSLGRLMSLPSEDTNTHTDGARLHIVWHFVLSKSVITTQKNTFLLISGTQVNTPIFRLTVNRYVFLIVGSLLHLVLFNPKYVAAYS